MNEYFLPTILDEYLKAWLKEDISYWDVTATLTPNKIKKARIICKEPCVLAGMPIIKRLFEKHVDCKFIQKHSDGDVLEGGEIVAEIVGNSRNILIGERLALNILGRLSGIATKANRLVTLAKKVNHDVRVAVTRKTTPGFRLFEKYAAMIGGADTHRFNLSDMIMIKDNHISCVEDLAEFILNIKKEASFSKKIEVEVEYPEKALEVARLCVDVIMLDNFDVQSVHEAVHGIREIEKEINRKIIIEVSGGITEENIQKYANAKPDVISSGSIIHSAKNIDFSMDFIC